MESYKKPKISVIIPVYNVRDYLVRCVDSVIHQSYQRLEIILVDDGATDDSGILCDELQKQDTRIQVIHKSNGGLSDARNVGFQRVTGQYVFFLDSDDWLREDAIEVLYDLLCREKADIAVANYFYQYDTSRNKAVNLSEDIIFTKDRAMEALLKNDVIKNFAWGKLYKKELLENCPFPVGKLFEDTYWTHLIFHRVDKIVLSKEELVFYYQRNNSISYTFDVKKLHLIEGYLERREFVKKEYPKMLYIVDETIITLILGIYLDAVHHFHWKSYAFIRKRELEVCRRLKEEIEKNSSIEIQKKKEYFTFMKMPEIYLVKILLGKIREKI